MDDPDPTIQLSVHPFATQELATHTTLTL
jgi:hypothetical protein